MRIVVLAICFFLLNCNRDITPKQLCSECDIFFKEHKRMKSALGFEYKNKDHNRSTISGHDFTGTLMDNRFCFLGMPEKNIFDFFDISNRKKVKDKLYITCSPKNNDLVESFSFYFKEVNGTRIHVGGLIDSILLKECLQKENRNSKIK